MTTTARWTTSLALAALAFSPLPALAQEDEPAAAARSFAFGLSAEGAATRSRQDGTGLSFDLYPTLDATLPFGDGWVAALSIAPETYASAAGGGFGGLAADDPYLFASLTITAPTGLVFGVEAEATFSRAGDAFIDETAFVFVEAPRLGRLSYGVLDSAAGEFCVEAPGGTANFAPDDLESFGTCEGFAERGTLLFNTPLMGGGTVLAASYSDSGASTLEDEAAARSVSAALAYEGPWRGGDLEWSAGVERALKFAGEPDHGAARATFLQAGAAWTQGALTYSLSGGVQLFERSGAIDQAGLAVGVSWQATERLLIATGATYARLGRYEDGRAEAGHETTLGIAAEVALIPERLRLDAGVSRAWRDFDDDDTVFGIGFAWEL